MDIQRIAVETGEDIVVLTAHDYGALVAAAEDDAKDAISKSRIHRIEIGGQDDRVILTTRQYDMLLAGAGDEDAEDRLLARIGAAALADIAAGRDMGLPLEIWRAIDGGENRIKAIRKYRGLTQLQLAAAAGLQQPYLSSLESGARTGSVESLRALAKALNAPLAVLMGD